jgi:hypothetical protein
MQLDVLVGGEVRGVAVTTSMKIGAVCRILREWYEVGDDTWTLVSVDAPQRFLRHDYTVAYCVAYLGLKSGDRFEFGSSFRPVTVQLVDETRVCDLDMTMSVARIIDVLCGVIGVAPHSFLLCFKEQGRVRRWLQLDDSLPEQGYTADRTLLLWKALVLEMVPSEDDDPKELHALFCRCEDSFLAGEWPASEQEALEMAAALAQVRQGDNSHSKVRQHNCRVVSFTAAQMPDLDKCLPIPWHPPRDPKGALAFLLCWKQCRAMSSVELGSLPRDVAGLVAREVYRGNPEVLENRVGERWKKLAGLGCDAAKLRFVQQCRTLRSYGVRCFPCHNGLHFGVSYDTLWEVDLRGRLFDVQRSWRARDLRRFSFSRQEKTISLDFGDKTEVLATDECDTAAEVIGAHIAADLRRIFDLF